MQQFQNLRCIAEFQDGLSVHNQMGQSGKDCHRAEVLPLRELDLSTRYLDRATLSSVQPS